MGEGYRRERAGDKPQGNCFSFAVVRLLRLFHTMNRPRLYCLEYSCPGYDVLPVGRGLAVGFAPDWSSCAVVVVSRLQAGRGGKSRVGHMWFVVDIVAVFPPSAFSSKRRKSQPQTHIAVR